MWVRCQKKTKLYNCNIFHIFPSGEGYDILEEQDYVLGHYSTKEFAIEVLNSIQAYIIMSVDNPEYLVFEMPMDEIIVKNNLGENENGTI